MPQMMPINWILSFIFFIVIFFIFISMNYYIFNFNLSKNHNKLMNKKMKNFFWKW